MTVHELSASLRTPDGKGGARKARRAGSVPAVVYGREIEPTSISLDTEQFTEFLKHHNYTTSLLRLKLEGAVALDGKILMIRDLQLHHIEREPLSVDLQVVDMSKPVNVVVPIIFEGEAKGIKLGGMVQYLARDVELSALPDRIPSAIHCNVTEMVMGDTLFAATLTLGDGVSLAVPADTPIVTCVQPREEKEKPAEAAEGEAAEGAADAAKKD